MNNKAQIAFVSVFVVAVLAILLLANLFIPQVKGSLNYVNHTEEYVKGAGVTNLTLAYKPLVTGTFAAENLTENPAGNYTILNPGTGLINFNNTAAATYTITYQYTPANYLTNTAERALWAVLIIAGIIGLVMYLFKAFNLTE